MRFQRELKAAVNISLDEAQNFYFYLIWVSSSQSGQERSVHKTEDNYNTKLVSVAIHLAGRLSCISLHLLKSWWEINEEAGLQLSVVEKINGFSVNMTVSSDLHRYEGGWGLRRKTSWWLLALHQNLIAFRQFLQGGQPPVVFASLPYLMKNYLIRRVFA